MQSKRTPASHIALGGILAALAVVIMSMGTLIPVATYVCPMICCLILELVRKVSGSRIAWAWYGAVAILGAMMAPDKEAAAVFAALGYYPIVKPKLDRIRAKWFWKGLLFNVSVLLLYWMLMNVLGFDRITSEFAEIGIVMTVLMLVLGNVIFFMLDRLLEMNFRIR